MTFFFFFVSVRSIRTKSDDYSIIIDGMFMCHFGEGEDFKITVSSHEKKYCYRFVLFIRYV